MKIFDPKLTGSIEIQSQVSGSIIPTTNETFDLGSGSNRWNDIYLAGSTIDLGGTKLTKDSNGNIEFKDASNNRKKIIVEEILIGSGDNRKILKVENGKSMVLDEDGNAITQMAGHIMPHGHDIYDLGSPTAQWRDLYLSSGSLYIDGTQVISSTSNVLTVTTDTGQSLKLLETGADDITIQTDTGNIELKGTVEILSGKKLIDSAGTIIQFGDSLGVTGSIEVSGTVDGIDLQLMSSSLDSRISTLTGKTIISSSAQIATDISGSNTAFSASVATRFEGLTTDYTELDNIPNNIISSSAQIASEISGSFTSASNATNTKVDSNTSNITSINAATSSYLKNTTDTLTGDLTVTGTITAQEFHTEFVSASILFDSGSTKFGDSSDDVHNFTGSLNVDGNIQTSGNITTNTGILDLNIGTTNIGIEVKSTDAGSYIRFDDGANANRWYLGAQNGNFGIYNNANEKPFEIDSSKNATFAGGTIIKSNGVVYLGYTDATAIGGNKLEVNGNIYGSGNATFAGDVTVNGLLKGPSNIVSVDKRLKIADGSEQLNIGQWDGTNHRIEGDANRPVMITSYEGNINLGTSGSTKLNVNTSGISVTGTGTFAGGIAVNGTNVTVANASNPYVYLNDTNAGAGIFQQEGNTTRIGSDSNTQVVLVQNNATAVTIDTDKNVGIGTTTSITAKLQAYQSATWDGSNYAIKANHYSTFNGIRINGLDGQRDIHQEYTTAGLGLSTSGAQPIKFTISNSTEIMRVAGNGNVGIGTTSPSAKLHVAGDVNITQTTDVGVLNTTNLDNGSAVGLSLTYPTSNVAGGDGLAIAIGITGRGRSYIANSNTSNNLDASKLEFYTEGGGVINKVLTLDENKDATFADDIKVTSSASIGTTVAPTRTLDVRGTGMSIFGTGGYTELMLRGQVEGTGTVRNVGSWHWSVRSDVGGNNDDLKLLRFVTGTYSGTSMQISNSTGNLGIGVNTIPNADYRLILEDTNEDLLRLHNSTDGLDALIAFTNPGGTLGRIQGIDNGGLGFDVGNNAGGIVSNAMFIKNNGNVGIGTTSPGVKLQVNGGIRAIGTTSTTGQIDASPDFGAFRFYNGSTFRGGLGTGQWASVGNSTDIVQYLNNVNYYISNGTTALVKVEAGGNVGIGNTAPPVKFVVNNGAVRTNTAKTYSTFIHTNDSDDYRVGLATAIKGGATAADRYVSIEASSYRLSTDAFTNEFDLLLNPVAGNVGIGLTNPAVPLHVDGWARLNGSLQLDGSNRQIMAIDNTSLLLGTNNTERMRIDSTGNVGIGTTSPGAKLDVVGDVYLRQTTFTNILRPYSTQQLTLLGGGANTLFVNGNVGIGTTSPGSNKLRIIGNTAKLEGSGTGYTAWFITNSGTGNAGTYYDAINGDTAGGDYGFVGQNNSGYMSYDIGTSSPMPYHVFTGGNVGIGTTSPAQKLHVNGNARIGTDTGRIEFARVGGSIVGGIGWHSDNHFYVAGHPLNGTGAGNNVRLYAFGSRLSLGNPSQGDVLNITSSGDVGIGTTNPSQKLHVIGTTNLQGAIQVSGGTFVDSTRRNIYLNSFAGGDGNGIFFRDSFTYNASITVEDHNGSSADGICISGYDGVSFSTGANTKNERMRIHTNGNVGIGTTNPSVKLDIRTDTGVLIKGATSAANGKLKFLPASGGRQYNFENDSSSFTIVDASAATTRMYFHYNGNLGIGTTNPSAMLDVLAPSSTTSPTVRFRSAGSYTFLSGGAVDPYHGLILRGTPSGATTYGVTAGDQMSFLEYGGDFRFYEKNSLSSGTLNEISRIHKTNSFFLSNVGIGTTTANQPLEIYKSVIGGQGATLRLTNIVGGTGAGSAIEFFGPGTQGIHAKIITQDLGVFDSKLIFQTKASGTGGSLSDRMTIDNVGNSTFFGRVSIGPGTTGSPYDANTFLHVKGTTRSIVQQSSTTDAYYMFGDAAANNVAWVGYNHSSGNLDIHAETSVSIDKNTNITGDLTVTGTLTAQEFRAELTTSTILYESGSTKFGDTSDDNHDFTGSLNVQGNVEHTGLTMTSGTDIDQLYSTTKSMTLTTSWQDTGINGTDLVTGTYVVAVYVHDHAVGGGHYYETYSGTMTWYHNDTNSTTSDEIILHKAGHHSGQNIYLRTKRTLTADTDDLKLQIAHSTTCTGNSDYVFKFRRLI